jgi:hypothetical protein
MSARREIGSKNRRRRRIGFQDNACPGTQGVLIRDPTAINAPANITSVPISGAVWRTSR